MANVLARDLSHLCELVERSATPGRFAQAFHLEPPVGWLNDPNGLCDFGGEHHAFFQYSPFDAEGGTKLWGHSVSRDLVRWEYVGPALFPDQPFDVSGVYSGCALVEDGTMHVFYTGNVKLEDSDDYDYVSSGREANTVHVASADGVRFGRKHVVMRNADYPSDDTQHVRDPKVWRGEDAYYMVQGARRVDDVGEVLVFRSKDLGAWELVNRATTGQPFGYMWECPDYFELADDVRGTTTRVLSVSPQGLAGGDWDRRNVYQSGYFPVDGDLAGECRLGEFCLWDAGFDFYAPQTFRADDGRRILIGWMGMPDEQTYGNPTIADGWQHCFTVPREVTVREGRVLQTPVRELEAYRAGKLSGTGSLAVEDASAFDLVVEGPAERLGSCRIVLAGELAVSWTDGRLELRFLEEGSDSVGAGRRVRWEPLEGLRNLRVIGDTSSVEVFANDGELVLSTRYYPKRYAVSADAPGAAITLWRLAV